ncbi:GGDEF domain-containing response regulator [Paenibacillus prosopidis]|uniref:Response regulator receiver modulated diguanylate cyclase n=1 Tax=Paenibacillus prosopidis TaxID=630520 RepID=A0A368W3V7_9BACL|nr:GGDEF domain-containing response regulator [Paenibacillus prosopidis]RCW49477.1 response regulator receiver modulated diguanylate cyclase [Paenibacillus prosopidis]
MIKVLLIEDNPGDARLIREVLSDTDNLNFDLKWVDQLETGIELISKDIFDVVLLDLSLPDSHGMETIISFREQAPAIPIVVLTGLDDEQVAINAVQHGAQDYLIKGQVNSSVIMRSMRYAIERHRLQGELYNLSIIDELTSLYNRRGFFNQAQQYMNANAQEGRGFYLVVADLDGMKTINDTYGHHMGDLALMDTANILKEVFSDSDIIARMGGDEFTVVLPDKLGYSLNLDAFEELIILKIQQKLHSFNLSAGRIYHLSISLGLFHFNPAMPVTLGELIIQADQRMYTHKKEKVLK